jgi:phosphopentomutase
MGKDTPSGHWELMGCPVPFDWGYFHADHAINGNIFPPAQMNRWLQECGLAGSLANCHASGTEVINQWGDEHLRTGMPICYTSSDSVFQIAVHQEAFGLERLYAICEKAKVIFDELNIARVIARPFLGSNGNYKRTSNRRDYTTPPPGNTLLDALTAAGKEVHAVGKIKDIFAARGITHHLKGEDNAALSELTLQALDECPDGGLVFTNLVDFDMLFGHRRDPAGYAKALEDFDAFLPTLQAHLKPGDLMALSADHGCDPTWPGSDHTREFVPLLFAGSGVPDEKLLGQRSSFADLGQTLAKHLELAPLRAGTCCW